MTSTVIIGWNDEGFPKSVPTEAEGNETIDAIAKEHGLTHYLALTKAEALIYGTEIRMAARMPKGAL